MKTTRVLITLTVIGLSMVFAATATAERAASTLTRQPEPAGQGVAIGLENGATGVHLDALRVHGGGGIYLGLPAGLNDRELLVSVGGHVGLEAFMSPGSSFYFEIGANGGNDDFFTGGTAMGGVLLYL